MEAYRKNIDPRLDADFKNAEVYGNISLTPTHIFHRKLLSVKMIPYADITRAWRRVEAVTAKTGCCSNDFSIHHLILQTRSGEEISLKIGEALYRHEPEALIEALKNLAPSIAIGKP